MTADNLPSRVVVGANGAYWRDYTDSDHPGYSMCPVSEDNEPVEVVAVYVRATPTPDTTEARAERELLRELLREAIETVHQTGTLRDHADPGDRSGWNVHGIETCRYSLCIDVLAALERSLR